MNVKYLLCHIRFIAITKPKKSIPMMTYLYIKWVQILCDFEPTLDEKSKGLP